MSSKQPAGSHFHLRNPTREGWLFKQSKTLKWWRKRWIVLQNAHLYSFKQERVYDNPTEEIDLSLCSACSQADDFTEKQYSFQVFSVDNVFTLYAENEDERRSWMDSINAEISDPHREDDDAWRKQFQQGSKGAAAAKGGSDDDDVDDLYKADPDDEEKKTA